MTFSCIKVSVCLAKLQDSHQLPKHLVENPTFFPKNRIRTGRNRKNGWSIVLLRVFVGEGALAESGHLDGDLRGGLDGLGVRLDEFGDDAGVGLLVDLDAVVPGIEPAGGPDEGGALGSLTA